MKSTITGLVILGVAIMIAISSRDNVDETAGQTFGTLGVILLLCVVGLSFVRSGEAERVRGKRNKPTKSNFKPPGGAMGGHGGKGHPFPGKPQASSSSFEVPQGLQMAVFGILFLAVCGATGYGVKVLMFPSDLAKLAEVEQPKTVAAAQVKLNPILDKMAERFKLDRGDVDDAMWTLWEANQKSLTEYGLKPSSYAREVMAAAPKEAELEKVGESIATEEPAARLARLHQPKPAPGTYPQQAAFQKQLDQLCKKTGIGPKPMVGALVNRWRVVFEKKKQNRNFSLMWFVQTANAKTKAGVKKTDWLARLSKLGG